jgi:crotonobetainyl-CoA:carnitine CoA-transferase CaiB-like acyl-CoA transferase
MLESGVPAARYQTMASLLEDEHLRSRGAFLGAVDDAGEFTVTATPFRLDDRVTPSQGTRVPALGADNDTLLGDLRRD